MTTHYIDLSVMPDAELSATHLFGALYDKLHRTLALQRIDHIGVSFPDYRLKPRQLGVVLRLHGAEPALRSLMGMDWLRGLRDHVHFTAIAAIPPDAKHRIIQRRQFKTNVERLRRRRMKRKGETAEEAALAIPSSVERHPDLPYAHLRSLTTGQPFCLFIELGLLREEPAEGRFNTYGLGEGNTVPWF